MITLYGIPNCNSVKKARAWLAAKQIDYVFHDFKKLGLSADIAQSWIEQSGWQVLINRQGTTWRTLSAAEQSAVQDNVTALALMLRQHSVIKRPVLTQHNRVFAIGFDEATYTRLTTAESEA